MKDILVRFFALVILWVLFQPALAHSIEIKYDSGKADDFTFQLTDAYLMRFAISDFEEPVIVGVSFYGYRYGEMDFLNPPIGYLSVLDEDYNKLFSLTIPYTKVSGTPSWNHIKIDPYILKEGFWVYFLFPSSAESGVMMGKDIDPEKFRSRTGNHSVGFRPLSDGHYNWMIRCEVSDGMPEGDGLTSEKLIGEKFLVNDGGKGIEFLTLFRYGATVAFDVPKTRTIDKVYIYGRLQGEEWFETEREFTLYLLDTDLRIQMTRNFPYTLFSSNPAWVEIDVPNTKLGGRFYLIVEPNSRDEAQFEIGHDGTANKGSSVTVIGQPEEWPFEVEMAEMNWMVRLKTL